MSTNRLRIHRLLFQYRDLFVALIFSLCSLFGRWPDSSIEVGLGAFLFILGASARVMVLSHFGRRVHGNADKDIIVTGAFSVVRNPIYIANLLAITGCTILVGGLYAGILAFVCAGLLLHACVLWEEEKLDAAFPFQFKSYCETVPRWIPKISTYAKGGRESTVPVAELIKIESLGYRKLLVLLIGIIGIRFL